jgi:hypothetical protein
VQVRGSIRIRSEWRRGPLSPDRLAARGEKEERAAHAAVLWLSTGRDMNVRRAAAGKLL